MTPETSAINAATGRRLRAVIIDDEPTARRGIKLLLERDREVAVAGEASAATEAVELIRREKPDLLFLDVQMPGPDGFELLQQLGADVPPAVVFVTAYDEHALRACEAQAGPAAVAVRCLAMLPPAFVEYALRNGAQRVRAVGCEDCASRLGMQLCDERFAGTREPHLRATVQARRTGNEYAFVLR